MPKHGLTFKHFLGSRPPQRQERKERSVNELLSSSRQSTPLSSATSAPVAATLPATTPTAATLGPVGPIVAPAATHATSTPPSQASRERPPHLWEDADVHPAELLRREQAAHLRAARSVAGPAPPRSWRAQKATNEKSPAERQLPESFVARELGVASAFLHGSTPATLSPGPPSLVSCCIGVVLSTIAGRADADGSEYDAQDMAAAMLFAARELSISLRGRILADSASRVPRDPVRLSDTAIRVLLEHDSGPHHPGQSERPVDDNEGSDWDDDPTPTLAHLPLTAHPAPLRLLQDVPRLRALSLTSVDLAFATLPAMDRVVHILPPTLRTLGLAGVRSGEGYASWARGMGALGKKMTVLHTLDISHLPILVSPILHALFGIDEGQREKHLPSLRRLGMRGNTSDGGGREGLEQEEGEKESPRDMTRAVVKHVVNRGGRKWVEITF